MTPENLQEARRKVAEAMARDVILGSESSMYVPTRTLAVWLDEIVRLQCLVAEIEKVLDE